MDKEPETLRAIAAIYDAVENARLRAGLPKIYVDDGRGGEVGYTIRDIKRRSDLPPDMSRIFFEFGNGNSTALLYLSAWDGSFKTDNFLEEDEEKVNSLMKSVDLSKPLPRRSEYMKRLGPEPKYVEEAQVLHDCEEPKVVSLECIFPQELETRAASIPISVMGKDYSLIENVGDMKLSAEKVHRKHRGIQRIRGSGADENVLRGEGLHKHVRSMMDANPKLMFVDIVEELERSGYNIGKKKTAYRTIADAMKGIAFARQHPSDSTPVPCSNETKAFQKKKKTSWDDSDVMDIVSSEFQAGHNFSQTLNALAEKGYKISKTNKSKVYDYFTGLMGQ